MVILLFLYKEVILRRGRGDSPTTMFVSTQLYAMHDNFELESMSMVMIVHSVSTYNAPSLGGPPRDYSAPMLRVGVVCICRTTLSRALVICGISQGLMRRRKQPYRKSRGDSWTKSWKIYVRLQLRSQLQSWPSCESSYSRRSWTTPSQTAHFVRSTSRRPFRVRTANSDLSNGKRRSIRAGIDASILT